MQFSYNLQLFWTTFILYFICVCICICICFQFNNLDSLIGDKAVLLQPSANCSRSFTVSQNFLHLLVWPKSSPFVCRPDYCHSLNQCTWNPDHVPSTFYLYLYLYSSRVAMCGFEQLKTLLGPSSPLVTLTCGHHCHLKSILWSGALEIPVALHQAPFISGGGVNGLCKKYSFRHIEDSVSWKLINRDTMIFDTQFDMLDENYFSGQLTLLWDNVGLGHTSMSALGGFAQYHPNTAEKYLGVLHSL